MIHPQLLEDFCHKKPLYSLCEGEVCLCIMSLLNCEGWGLASTVCCNANIVYIDRVMFRAVSIELCRVKYRYFFINSVDLLYGYNVAVVVKAVGEVMADS